MATGTARRLIHNFHYARNFLRKQEWQARSVTVNNVLMHFQSSKVDKVENDVIKEGEVLREVSLRSEMEKNSTIDCKRSEYVEDSTDSNWRSELAWLTKTLEPALQLYRWALSSGDGIPHRSRSVSEIIASIQRSKTGIQDWSLSDLTIGLCLIYLRQASTNPLEDLKGVQISSNAIVEDLIYFVELAEGSYKNSTSMLAKTTMLRECNILKFVKNSSVMRPGYYIGVDTRKKLVIFGIRGTHTVYDLITDIITTSDRDVTFEGYSTHFGTSESAQWFLQNEIGMIRRCLEKYQGFRLRLVGHSLGGAIASLLAVMLRKKSKKELGFSPDIVSAIGFGTPPCVSRKLAESCADYVTTVVMQDDVIPRLSVASLTRLRIEILQTDWMSLIGKEDWKSIIGLVTNAKQVVTSVQDVAQKLADYAKFTSKKKSSDDNNKKESDVASGSPRSCATSALQSATAAQNKAARCKISDELFIPGTVYYLKRHVDSTPEYFSLWKRHPDEHFQQIVLSNILLSDHKCDSHYYALRDVLKGLPISSCSNEGILP
ncbi:Alpha/beta-Hydrolases superfamily protein [Cucumis melo var. makuwa]|uniref:Alpha/beta-Hydrolases superfamily protein n=1 Tax=Cucumis melo var. makuwa TaxID=1194695 RepID=A0A5A7TF50_CUCMM|nr:Alpha/beta-Hydrolases superfamily protein [Cucumis melo var. makuwa]